MKKINLIVALLLATIPFVFTSCTHDDHALGDDIVVENDIAQLVATHLATDAYGLRRQLGRTWNLTGNAIGSTDPCTYSWDSTYTENKNVNINKKSYFDAVEHFSTTCVSGTLTNTSFQFDHSNAEISIPYFDLTDNRSGTIQVYALSGGYYYTNVSRNAVGNGYKNTDPKEFFKYNLDITADSLLGGVSDNRPYGPASFTVSGVNRLGTTFEYAGDINFNGNRAYVSFGADTIYNVNLQLGSIE